MTPVLPFWLQTAEWDIDDDANIVFTPHCPHQEFVHNDDDDGFGHNDDDDSIKLNDDDDDSFSQNDGNDYTNFLSSLPPSTTHLSLCLDDDQDDSNDIRNGDDNEVQTIDDTNIVFPTAANRETLGQNTPHWIHKEEVATLICVLTFEIAHSCLQRDIT